MAVKIRLRRMGQKKAPFYRIVVADSRCKRDGRCIAEIGSYVPISSIHLPSLGDLESATTILYKGAFFCPILLNLIFTAMSFHLLRYC